MQHRPSVHRCAPSSSQRGAALLIFLIIAVLGSASYMMAGFNTQLSAPRTAEASQSRNALRAAKEALLGAAVAVVDEDEPGGPAVIEVRPGQLPWPDRAEDGNYDGNSDCNALTPTPARLLGRFPFLGSADCFHVTTHVTTVALNAYVEDGAGEPLWYALSRNVAYYNASADASVVVPAEALFGERLKIGPALVDAPVYPWMRVCDANGNLVADNVAAVIIAPGPALAGQARAAPAPAATEYLDTITIGGLSISNADSDELPDSPALCNGLAMGGEDFVAPIGLTEAQRSSFNDHLIYITAEELLDAVQIRAMNAVSNALRRHLASHGVMPWLSPFANVEAGAPLFINTVATAGVSSFTSSAPAGGAIDTLFDAPRLSGAAIRNTTDGSTAQVVAVAGNVVTTTDLIGGTNNVWQAGDIFHLPTFRGDPGTRFGHVPFHDPQVGEDRRADFSVLWDLQADNVAQVEVTPFPNAHAAYIDTITAAALSSVLSGAVTVGSGTFDAAPGALSGVCRQAGQSGLASGQAYARCQGRAATRVNYLDMQAGQDDATVLLAKAVIDAVPEAFDFAAWGIARGDLVTNTTDGSKGIVTAVGVAGDPLRLAVAGLFGGTNNIFAEDDNVTVQLAAGTTQSTATGGTNTTLVDLAANFVATVAVGDVVLNDGDGSVARVTAVPSATELTLTGLIGGGANEFSAGDDYTVRSSFVGRRQVTFDLLLSGQREPVFDAANNPTYFNGEPYTFPRQSVYAVRSNTSGGQETIVQPPVPAVSDEVGEQFQALYVAIHVQDFDNADNLVGEVKVKLDTDSKGYIEVRNIEQDFLLNTVDTDTNVNNGANLPRWIYEQGWHEYIAVAVGNEFQPDGDGACDNAGDCLTVTSYDRQSNANANAAVPAVILGAGVHVGSAVPRPTADVSAYFEGKNSDSNLDDFEHRRFNPANLADPANPINDTLAIPCTNAIPVSVVAC